MKTKKTIDNLPGQLMTNKKQPAMIEMPGFSNAKLANENAGYAVLLRERRTT